MPQRKMRNWTMRDQDLDLSINWQTSHWEYHANEKEVMLLAVFRLQAGLERRHRRAYHSLVL